MILVHPVDKTVFLDDDAVFTCLTDIGSTAHWMLNETDYDDLSSQLQHDLVIRSESTTQFGVFSITIPARAEYNGTRVQCVAESDDGHSVVSDNATLTIQGMSLTLSTHAQRGLQYLVCVSVCVSAVLFSHLVQLRCKQEIRATSTSLGQQK